MKKLISLFIIISMIFSLLLVPTGQAEQVAAITNILGSRERIYVYFDGGVSVSGVSVTDLSGKAFGNTYSYDTAKNKLSITLSSVLNVKESYILTVSAGNEVYEKKIGFDILVDKDFSDADDYTSFSQSRWDGNSQGKKFADVNASNIDETLIAGHGGNIGSAESSVGYKATQAQIDSWKDYTVEFDYMTVKSGFTAKAFYVYFLSSRDYSVMAIYDKWQSATVSTDSESRYCTKTNVEKGEYPTKIEDSSCTVTGDKTRFGQSDLRVTGSLLNTDMAISVRNASTNELLYSKTCVIPVDFSTLNRQAGTFAFAAMGQDAGNKDTLVFDNVLCYKMTYGDVEYKASIANNAKNLYDVSEVTFTWKNDIEVTADNVEMTADGEEFSDYTVSHENSVTKISFQNGLSGEKKYVVSFKNLGDVKPFPLTFTTGGVYKSIEVISENEKLPIGEKTKVTVKGITEKGNSLDFDISDVLLSSDNENVLTVSENGEVTAVGKGEANIVAVFTDPRENPNADANNAFSAFASISVYAGIEDVKGTREGIAVTFGGEVSPVEAYFSERETGDIIKAELTLDESKKVVAVVPEKLLSLDKKYIMTVKCDDMVYDKNISFDILMKEDFSSADAYKRFTMGRWGGTADGKNYDNVNAERGGEYLVFAAGNAIGSAEVSLGYNATAAEKASWKDYTVEFDYLTEESGFAGDQFCVYFLSDNSLSMCVMYDDKQAVTVGTDSGFTRYKTSDKKQTTLTNTVVGSKKDFGKSDLKVSGSMLGKSLIMNVRNADTEELLYSVSAEIPVELSTLFRQTGTFGIHARGNGVAATDTMAMDNVVCYKLASGEVEYSSSIAINARDLYDVHDVTIDWNYNIPTLTEDNIVITEDGKPYSDFSVTHSDNTTYISFNTDLKGESEYKITFKNVIADSGEIDPMALSFFMGGVYKNIHTEGDRIMKKGGVGVISVKGTTDTGNVYTVVNDNIVYSSDNENVVAVDEEGNLKALDRGSAKITAVFTDTNPANPYATDGKFTTETLVYSYISEETGDDFSFKNGVLSAKFDSDISVKFGEGFSFERASDGEEHTLEILKNEGEMYAYVDGVMEKKADNADKCVKLTEKTGLSDAKIYNLIGSVCEASFVNIRNDGYLSGVYKYSDADNDKEYGSKFRWFSSSSENGEYTQISGADKPTFNASSYKGKYIKFEVTPANAYEEGEAVLSPAYYVKKESENSGSHSSSKTSNKTSGSVSVSGDSVSTGAITETTAIAYKDVTEAHWAYGSIAALSDKGVLNGFEDGSFKPDNYVTRAEFICALMKLKGESEGSESEIFKDVTSDDWFFSWVFTAYEKGYIKGDGEYFYPNSPITRQEMAVIISRAYKMSQKAELSFSDNDKISEWAYDAVAKLVAKGVLQGKGNNMFEPLSYTTRAEMATVFAKLGN